MTNYGMHRFNSDIAFAGRVEERNPTHHEGGNPYITWSINVGICLGRMLLGFVPQPNLQDCLSGYFKSSLHTSPALKNTRQLRKQHIDIPKIYSVISHF